MTKKQLLVGLVILAGIAVTLAFNVTHSEVDSNTVKIGVVIPLTGNQAFAGESMKNAIQMAVQDLDRNEPSHRYKYEVIFEDSQFDSKIAVSAAQKLINIDRVDVIVDAYAPIGNAISPIAEQNNVVHVSVAFDPKIAEGDYNFLLFTTPETAARTFLREMQKRGLRTLGIFRVNNQGIYSVYSAVAKLANEYGVSIVSDQMFQSGEHDFRGIITENAKSKADIYALLALSPELELLGTQMKDFGLKNQTTVIYFEVTPNKSVFEGLWSVGYGAISNDWYIRYKDLYGKEPSFGAPNVYDIFNVIVRAAESNKGLIKPSHAFIRDQIMHMPDTEGVLGRLHVDSQGIIDTAASIKIVKQGQLVPE